jgi:hypothetical protein
MEVMPSDARGTNALSSRTQVSTDNRKLDLEGDAVTYTSANATEECSAKHRVQGRYSEEHTPTGPERSNGKGEPTLPMSK